MTVLFLHIQKTGGASIRAMMADHYGEAFASLKTQRNARKAAALVDGLVKGGTRAVAVHAGAGILDHLTCDPTTFTVLRHPVDRCVSMYHWQQKGNRPKVAQMGLDRWIDDVLTDPSLGIYDVQTRMLSTGRLAGGEPCLDKAIDTLGGFDSFGITERLSDFAQSLTQRFGWESALPHVHASASLKLDKPSGAPFELHPSTRLRIALLNPLDMQLYAWAVGELAVREEE
jgi:hypothetical protein